MATDSGNTTSVSNKRRNLSSEGDDHQQSRPNVMDQRQQKRMLSNRVSARRSRERKQAKFNGLLAEVNRLQNENKQIFRMMIISSQEYKNLLSQNRVLNAERDELERKFINLYEIILSVNYSNYYGVYTQPGMVYYTKPNIIYDHCAQSSVIHHTEPSIIHHRYYAQPQSQPSVIHHTDSNINIVQCENPNPLTVEDYLNDTDAFNYPYVFESTAAPANDAFMF